MKSAAAGVAAAVVLLSGAIGLARARDVSYPLPPVDDQTLYLTSPKAAQRLALEFQTLAADLYEQEPGFQDFVIAHELLHLRVPTHGRLFKALMTAHVPNWREFDVARQRPRSGNNSRSPAREAAQMPRSVTSAVTSRAGVTSKA